MSLFEAGSLRITTDNVRYDLNSAKFAWFRIDPMLTQRDFLQTLKMIELSQTLPRSESELYDYLRLGDTRARRLVGLGYPQSIQEPCKQSRLEGNRQIEFQSNMQSAHFDLEYSIVWWCEATSISSLRHSI
eukprot:c3348_g1_i1.p1 GENE.c3348_g1_i1~~c3348_g1_i1.p1  ORF type:complete len:131 (+),score=10.36 c3348_g1_i1:79-471(+)